jgi:glycosyltransferase involved in cell wall biosynthesis
MKPSLANADEVVRPLVSIVAPVYNEREALPAFLDRLVKAVDALSNRYHFEFIWVDDGSRDDSLLVAQEMAAREPRLRVVELRKNYGQTAALQAGLDEAQGGIIISMDADLQHFPEEIPAFLTKIEEGYDIVCGWRHQRQETALRRWPSHIANRLIRWVSGVEIRDVGTTFRAYRMEIIRELRLLGENHRFVPVLASAVGARITEIPITNIDRPFGCSNYGLARTLNVFIDMFFVYFFIRYLDRPLRIFGKVALVVGLLAVLITLYLALIWLYTGTAVVREHSGLFISALVLYLATVQFFMAGILSEMLSRIYFNTEEKSHYRVRQVWGSRPHTSA